MVTSEYIDLDNTGRMKNCSPTSYKIPNVRSIPRKFNVTLLKNHNVVKPVYSSKVRYQWYRTQQFYYSSAETCMVNHNVVNTV